MAEKIERTVLSGVTNTEFPHAFAVREEIRTWKFLQLNAHLLSQMVTNFSDTEQVDMPLRQLLVNTHSPGFISQPGVKDALLFAYTATRIEPQKSGSFPQRITRIVPVYKTYQQISLNQEDIYTEAWMLADSHTLCQVLGTNLDPQRLGLSGRVSQVENIARPKDTINEIIRIINASNSRHRRAISLNTKFELLARRIDLNILLEVSSYQKFVKALAQALEELHLLAYGSASNVSNNMRFIT